MSVFHYLPMLLRAVSIVALPVCAGPHLAECQYSIACQCLCVQSVLLHCLSVQCVVALTCFFCLFRRRSSACEITFQTQNWKTPKCFCCSYHESSCFPTAWPWTPFPSSRRESTTPSIVRTFGAFWHVCHHVCHLFSSIGVIYLRHAAALD